jgi:hypothetical protein
MGFIRHKLARIKPWEWAIASALLLVMAIVLCVGAIEPYKSGKPTTIGYRTSKRVVPSDEAVRWYVGRAALFLSISGAFAWQAFRAWRRDRRNGFRIGLPYATCPKCLFPRTGLAPGAKCPECGFDVTAAVDELIERDRAKARQAEQERYS